MLLNSKYLFLPPTHAVMCDELPDVDNGQIQLDSPDVGNVANYSCDQGYVLLGVQRRTCTEDGSWSDIEPSCIRE